MTKASADLPEAKTPKAPIPTAAHPAWAEFEVDHQPIESMINAKHWHTTASVLNWLNTICMDEYYSESTLYKFLKEKKYTLHNVEGTDIYLWLFK